LRLIALLPALAAMASPPPRRIVSTAPSVTELLFELGAGGRIVGVTTYCRWPEAARALPKVGTFLEPNYERILALRPDLVVTIRNPVRLTERLREMGLNALEVDTERLSGVYAAAEAIGRALGSETQGRDLAARIRAGLAGLRPPAGAQRPSVLLLVGRSPGALDNLIAAGRDTYLHEVLEAVGGRNVVEDAPVPYPKISIETVLKRDPDAILDMTETGHAEGKARETSAAVRALWSKYPRLKAFGRGRIHVLEGDHYVVPGPRVVEAARAIRRLIYEGAL
jgi:iron complex transport system substrate-binding protein